MTVGRRAISLSLIVGIVGLILCFVGSLDDLGQFYRSYLFAYLFWLGPGFGSLGILMVGHVVGGGWSAAIRPVLEPAALTLPLLALLFIPLVFGLGSLYPWASREVVASDALLQAKSAYLNVPFFLIRTVIYLVAWSALAVALTQATRERLPRLSAVGLLVLSLTATFAMIDWVMSLEPQWYSTVYAAMVAFGAVLTAFAFAVFVRVLFASRATTPEPPVLNDLGSLLLAILMSWAYLAFSQFLVIWSGNLSQEIPWYVRRLQGGWEWLALAVALLHFALPFVLLLSRTVKRNARALALIAALLFVTGILDVFWLVTPAFFPEGLQVHWLDLAALIGIGGLWIAAFARNLRRRALLPAAAPDYVTSRQEAPDHG